MTDNEILVALRRCADNACYMCTREGKTCQRESIAGIAWNVMYNLKTENEKKKAEIEALIAGQETLQKYMLTIKAEAVKEFAERLKSRLITVTYMNFDDTIDNLVKEMVGEG